jgi:hypothetical protein
MLANSISSVHWIPWRGSNCDLEKARNILPRLRLIRVTFGAQSSSIVGLSEQCKSISRPCTDAQAQYLSMSRLDTVVAETHIGPARWLSRTQSGSKVV